MTGVVAAAEAVFLALCAWPAAGLLRGAAFRRVFPRVRAMLAAILLAWCLTLVVLAWYVPVLLHPLALTGGLLAAGAAWRARPDFGRARGLPPGSLSLRASVEGLADREFYLKQAARHGAIFKTAQFHHRVVCVVGLARGHDLLRQHARILGPSTQPFTRQIAGGFLRYMDDEAHAVYGLLFRRALSESVVAASRPAVAAIARSELRQAAIDARGAATGGVCPAPYLRRIVHGAFVQVLFGLQPGSRAFDEFARYYRGLAAAPLSRRLGSSARASLDELRRFLDAHRAAWLTEPGRAVPVCALSELGRLDARMPDATCIDNLLFIQKISASNVEGLLAWILAMLGPRAEWRARLRQGLESPGSGSTAPCLADRVVMETLRLAQSEYLYRRLAQDAEFGGFLLPKGWLVRVCVWESHRSADVFADPERFDPDRFLSRDYGRSEYSPFGATQHACNGVALTYLIARALIEELSRGYDWAVTGHEDLARDFRHWSHWRPGPRLRLHLEPVPQAPPVPASATSHAR